MRQYVGFQDLEPAVVERLLPMYDYPCSLESGPQRREMYLSFGVEAMEQMALV
jgi:hypothetical protein